MGGNRTFPSDVPLTKMEADTYHRHVFDRSQCASQRYQVTFLLIPEAASFFLSVSVLSDFFLRWTILCTPKVWSLGLIFFLSF